MSDLLNAFSAAGLWIETTVEPQLSKDARRRYPYKQAWMDKYLGILIFVLRPLPGHWDPKTNSPATAAPPGALRSGGLRA